LSYASLRIQDAQRSYPIEIDEAGIVCLCFSSKCSKGRASAKPFRWIVPRTSITGVDFLAPIKKIFDRGFNNDYLIPDVSSVAEIESAIFIAKPASTTRAANILQAIFALPPLAAIINLNAHSFRPLMNSIELYVDPSSTANHGKWKQACGDSKDMKRRYHRLRDISFWTSQVAVILRMRNGLKEDKFCWKSCKDPIIAPDFPVSPKSVIPVSASSHQRLTNTLSTLGNVGNQ
jgi:hypothetical protein